MAGNVGTGKQGADINVVPLIDIVLVLLIIFMVITPLIIKQMPVHLPEVVPPEVPTPPPLTPPKPQVVVLIQCQHAPPNPNAQCPDYQVYLGKNAIDEGQLGAALTAMTSGWAPDDKIMFFDAQDQVNYKTSVKILDIAKGAGIQKIGLITDRPKDLNLVPGNPSMPGTPGAPAAPTHG